MDRGKNSARRGRRIQRPARRGDCWRLFGLAAGALGAIAVVAVVAFGPARPALAWGRMAHRAATRLAETRLTPEARAAIRDLLEPGESLADASTWADENSRNIPGSASWHYVNVPISAPRYTSRDCRDNCVVSRFEEFRKVLADPHAPKPRRRMALRYVIHLLEDAHQPMHVGDNRDRGGNAVQLRFFGDDQTNLHQVWDSGLLRVGYRRERELTEALIDLARRPEARDWSTGRIEDWVNESLEAARQAYRVPGERTLLRSGMRIGREYQEANLPIAVERLARAGYRLSDVLNASFAPRSSGAISGPHFRKRSEPGKAPAPLASDSR